VVGTRGCCKSHVCGVRNVVRFPTNIESARSPFTTLLFDYSSGLGTWKRGQKRSPLDERRRQRRRWRGVRCSFVTAHRGRRRCVSESARREILYRIHHGKRDLAFVISRRDHVNEIFDIRSADDGKVDAAATTRYHGNDETESIFPEWPTDTWYRLPSSNRLRVFFDHRAYTIVHDTLRPNAFVLTTFPTSNGPKMRFSR